jgi:predicted ribonuclease YlaK
MEQTYILDTSVILSDPNCLESFSQSTIIIQEGVLAELDKIKTSMGEVGKNARVFIKKLDALSEEGDVVQGIKMKNNTLLKIDVELLDASIFGDASYVDNKILACAFKHNATNKATIVSRDINLRLRAKAFGVGSKNYVKKSENFEEFYQGYRVLEDPTLGYILKKKTFVKIEEFPKLQNLHPNECINIVDENGKSVALGREIEGQLVFLQGERPWGLEAKNVEQAMAMDLLMDPDVPLVSLSGIAGTGKAQPLDAKILTPSGWSTMGEIKPNSYVIGSDGKKKKVISVHPQGVKEIFKVTFSDGTSTECCDEHLWLTKTCLDRWNNKAGSVKSLSEIRKTLHKYGKRNHSIPMVEPVHFKKNELIIDPYLLGVIIGDGGISTKSSVTISSKDKNIIDKCSRLLPVGLTLNKKSNSKYNYYITKGFKSKENNPILNELRNLELQGLTSEKRFIPNIYKISSIKDRIKLLQGLMDTDGFCAKPPRCENVFYTTSYQLAKDVIFIAQSLGCKATLKDKQTRYTYKNETKSGKPSYCVYISPPPGLEIFSLPRKQERFTERTKYKPTKYIEKIEFVGKKEAQCIYIDSKDHLYVTDDFILTHNTLITVACGLENVINLKTYNKLIIYRPLQPVGKDIGYLPGDMEEKLDPWMGAIKDSMELLTSPLTSNRRRKKFGSSNDWKEAFSRYMDQIHLEALTHIRGRSINNAFIVMDECFPYDQNIRTKDGKEKIGRIYKKFKAGEKIKVKTFNEEKKCFEYKLVTNAWDRGLKSLIQLKMGNRKIKCTPDHKFLTEDGWKSASDIKLGELILTSEPDEHQLLNSLNKDQFNLMIGSYLGDGHMHNTGESRYRLRVQHGIGQNDYCTWKSDIFKSNTNYIEKNGFAQKPAVKFQSKCFGLNKKINNKNKCPQWIIESLNEASFAIWYMDDGSLNGNAILLSTCSFDEDSCERLILGLKDKFGVNSRIANYKGYNYIYIDTKSSEKIFKKINKFIHPSMDYKIPERFRTEEKYLWNNNFNKFGFTVLDSKIYLPNQEKVYDIEVEDNHNFILCSQAKGGQGLGGPIAHNCQNIPKKDIKTLLTRVGHGTKIVLTGDVEQIDNGDLDAMDNGLTNTIDSFKNDPLAGHITLSQGERSPLATRAAEIL